VTTTLTTTTPATDTAVADLILARMALPSKNPVPSSAVYRDVTKILGPDFSLAEFDELRNDLAASGLLTKAKRNVFALTDAGRERALHFLGVTELASRVNWPVVIAEYLFPKAAGMPADAAAKLGSSDKLAALVLMRKHGLATGPGSTVSQVLEALVCKRLGFENETTLEGLLCMVLSQVLGSERLTKEKLAEQMPLFETGISAMSADAARCAIVRDWLGAASSRPRTRPAPDSATPEPFDHAAFAATVRALGAKSPPADRIGDNQVFIAALWRSTQEEPSFPRLSLPEFKKRLIEANTQGLLHLSRADLVSTMDPQLVADSETESSNATFHFVLLDGDRSMSAAAARAEPAVAGEPRIGEWSAHAESR
jgi:hypothetical protein